MYDEKQMCAIELFDFVTLTEFFALDTNGKVCKCML